MDPVTILLVAFVALVAVVLSLVAFKMFFKETNFEEAYGASALRLLSEEKGGKAKAGKSNKNKAKGSEKRKEKDSSSDKETKPEKKAEDASPQPEPVAVTEETKQTDTSPESKQKKKKNRHSASGEVKHVEAEVESLVQKAVIAVEHAVAKPISAPVAEATTPEDTSAADGLATKAKKRRARRSSEHQKDQNVVKEETQHAQAEAKTSGNTSPAEPPKEEKKIEKPTKPKKPALSVKDINVDRLHTRLCAVSDLEPEYLSFLASYFSDTGAQKTKFSEEISALRKQIADKDRVVLQCTEKLNNAQKKDSEIAQLQHAVSEEKKKYALYEQSVRTQMTNGIHEKNILRRSQDELKSEIAALKEEMKKAQAAVHAAPPVDTTAFQQQIDVLNAELKSAKSKSSQLESELGQRMQVLQQLQNDAQNRDRQLERLNQAIAASEKRANEAEEKSRQEVSHFEMKLNSSTKMVEEMKSVVSKVREDAIQQAASDKTNMDHELQTLKQQMADVEKERDEARRDVGSVNSRNESMEAEHKKALSALRAEITELSKGNKENEARIQVELSGTVEELTGVRKELAVERQEKKMTADLLASATKELEVTKNDKQKMQADLEVMQAKLEEASKLSNASDLKCAHCAARIMDKQPPAVCGFEFRPRDEILSPLRREAQTDTRSTATSPVAALLCDGDSYIEPPKTPPKGSSPFVPEVRMTPPAVQKFESSKAISESDAEEEDLEWRETHVRPQAFVCFDLVWIVPDWNADDAPHNVLVSGSFWGWQPARPMTRTNVGFCLQVELPLTCEETGSPMQYAKSDSGRGSPLVGHQTAHEFKFVVDGEWRCADHYAKKGSKDGRFLNNVVYY